MQKRKTNYEREEDIVDVLDNCDDPVIHIGSSNEVPMVDSDNVYDNIVIINIPSNFSSPPFDYRTLSHGSNLKKFVQDFPWLYYNTADQGLQM